MTSATRGWGLCLAAALGAGALAGPGVPDAEASEAPDIGLRLADVTGVLGDAPDEEDADARASSPPRDLSMRVLVENRGDEAIDGLRLVVEVHGATGSRSELAEALDGDGPTTPAIHTPIDEPVRDLGELAPGEIAGMSQTVERDQVAWAASGGVHPVSISLLRGTEVLDELVTAVVWLAEDPRNPMLTTVVWPLVDAPWQRQAGHYPAGTQRNVEPGGRVDVLLRALERHPDAGVLPAPAAHLLEDLDDQATGFVEVSRQEDGTPITESVEPEDDAARRANHVLRRLRDVLDELPHAPVSGPYADADLGALLHHDADPARELAGELASLGWQRLNSLVDREADRTTFVVDAPVGEEVLDLLPVDHLLLAAGTVADGEASATELHRVRAPSGRPLTAAVGDDKLTQLLADPEEGGVVGAQRVLAETAMMFFVRPGEQGRTLSVHPPPDWEPDARMLDELLEGLEGASWLRLVSPSRQASGGSLATGGLELLDPEPDGLPAELAEDLQSALEDLEAADSARPADADVEPERSSHELRDALLRSTSRWLAGGTVAQDLVDDVAREVDQSFGGVAVAGGSRITLTSDTGQIPVTVRRTRGDPITLRVEVTSHGQLTWPEGRQSDELVLGEGEASTVSFRTEARSTGTFPVTVMVTDPTGTRELERTIVRVRSNAVSRPALSATGALVLGLLLLGAVRRRPKEPRLRVLHGDSPPEPRY